MRKTAYFSRDFPTRSYTELNAPYDLKQFAEYSHEGLEPTRFWRRYELRYCAITLSRYVQYGFGRPCLSHNPYHPPKLRSTEGV